MSADRCIAYFGLKFEVDADQIEDIELRSDQRVVDARKFGLKYYCGNIGGLQENYVMFVGAQLSLMGLEDSLEFSLSLDDLQDIIGETIRKLIDAGFEEKPSLYLQWQADA